MRAEWKLRPFDLLTRLFIASHSSIQSTEANFQHPVGPKTTRSPVDNSLVCVACEPPRPTAYCPLLFHEMTVPTAPFRRAAASGLYYVFLEAAVGTAPSKHRAAGYPLWWPSRLCRPRRNRSVSRLCYRCPTVAILVIVFLPPGRGG